MTEFQLVQLASEHLPNSLGAQELDLAFEFDYRRGRVDIVGSCKNGKLYAFEAKLTKWKSALQQAYRCTGFADFTYVVLPKSTAQIALRYQAEFEARGVGLLAFEGNQLSVSIPAPRTEPIQTWLRDEALDFVNLAHS